jgi:hypothetical protein
MSASSGDVSPAFWTRFTYALAVLCPTPMLAAIFRVDIPLAWSRRASRILRIVSLFMGLPALSKEQASPPQDCPAASEPHPDRVTGCPGIGDRIRLEWVTGSNRNPRPDHPGMRSAGDDMVFTSDHLAN